MFAAALLIAFSSVAGQPGRRAGVPSDRVISRSVSPGGTVTVSYITSTPGQRLFSAEMRATPQGEDIDGRKKRKNNNNVEKARQRKRARKLDFPTGAEREAELQAQREAAANEKAAKTVLEPTTDPLSPPLLYSPIPNTPPLTPPNRSWPTNATGSGARATSLSSLRPSAKQKFPNKRRRKRCSNQPKIRSAHPK